MTIDEAVQLAGDSDALRTAIAALILEEREACAMACEDQGAYRDEIDMAYECAWAIRRRPSPDIAEGILK